MRALRDLPFLERSNTMNHPYKVFQVVPEEYTSIMGSPQITGEELYRRLCEANDRFLTKISKRNRQYENTTNTNQERHSETSI